MIGPGRHTASITTRIWRIREKEFIRAMPQAVGRRHRPKSAHSLVEFAPCVSRIRPPSVEQFWKVKKREKKRKKKKKGGEKKKSKRLRHD